MNASPLTALAGETPIGWTLLSANDPLSQPYTTHPTEPAPPKAATVKPQHHQAVINPATTVHWVIVPPAQQGWVVVPWVSTKGLTSVDAIAAELPAAAVVLNGGYFDPANGKTASSVWTWDERLFSPDDNERLTENSKLKPYWELILNRSQWQVWHCAVSQPRWRYEVAQPMIETIDAQTDVTPQPMATAMPSDCTLQAWLGAGPALLPSPATIEEAFVDEKIGRDAIGANRPDARSAVAKRTDGSVLLAWVQQTKPSGGLSLQQSIHGLRHKGQNKPLT